MLPCPRLYTIPRLLWTCHLLPLLSWHTARLWSWGVRCRGWCAAVCKAVLADRPRHSWRCAMQQRDSDTSSTDSLEGVSSTAPSASNSRPVGLLGQQWFSLTWRGMAQALGLKKLQELIQGTTALTEQPAWLLGTWYGVINQDTGNAVLVPEMEAALVADFCARLWFTYRSNFPAIGDSALSSDVGWGCTIRSGQMLLGEALVRHTMGRLFARPADAAQSYAMCDLLQLFVDGPSTQHPFSIHALCQEGAPHGVVVGRWLGPWVLCKTLEAAVSRQQHLGLHIHVVCDPGGGAPTLAAHHIRPLLQLHEQRPQGCAATDTAAHGQPDVSDGTAGTSGRQHASRGVLLLVPLTLGVGKINERYLPQLQQLLTFPQSVGIVGGRPGASLFFVGTQGSGVLYLDPHEVQEAVSLPQGMSTYFCDTPRVMPLASIDPSLAIGLYCAAADDFDDLCKRLSALAAESSGAPLMTIITTDAPTMHHHGSSSDAPSSSHPSSVANIGSGIPAGGGTDDWEFV